MTAILNVNSSVRMTDSASRLAGMRLIEQLKARHSDATITRREVTDEAEFISEKWVGASFSSPMDRTTSQNKLLAPSDKLAREVLDADILVITVSLYNFGIPASLKAWIDQIARPGLTFRPDPELTYVGLATGKSAYLCVATGETDVGGHMDFVTPYLQHVLGFIGIVDTKVISAERSVLNSDTLSSRIDSQVHQAISV